MTHHAADLTAPRPTLILPGASSGPVPDWASRWAEADPGVVLARHEDQHHALPAIREFETGHLILANPDAVVVAEGLAATVLLRMLVFWPHLPLAAALLIDPVDPATDPSLRAFGALPDTPLPLPAILYLTGPASARDHDLARHWDCVIAEGAAEGAGQTTEVDPHLPRLWSLRDQLARIRRPRPETPGMAMVPAGPSTRGRLAPQPLPRLLY